MQSTSFAEAKKKNRLKEQMSFFGKNLRRDRNSYIDIYPLVGGMY